ncbi:hypothetical protein DS901_01560 [Loktanella sp. D2R18]|nr:hypothetical protein DS901_01560 [Loktanella sp. D2R18]
MALAVSLCGSSTPALAEDVSYSELCLVSEQWNDAPLAINGRAVSVEGLEPHISIPSEGMLKLHIGAVETEAVWSPTGDFIFGLGPYDPDSGRVYVYGWFVNGWINVLDDGEIWRFGESGTIHPNLYDPPDDIDDVQGIHRSSVLGRQFYSGYTKPHWLTGFQSYRVYEIIDTEMLRVPVLERDMLRYYKDDVNNGFATFVSVSANFRDPEEILVLYDGIEITQVNLRDAISNQDCDLGG